MVPKLKIAYIILAHKLPEQLLRLINRLNAPNTSFFVHIDKKTNKETYEQILQSLNDLENVFFVKRFRSKWGQMGIVRGTLSGLREISSRDLHFDYVFLLSGQCYPIKTNEKIQEFLNENTGRSFIDFKPISSSQNQDRLERLVYWHYFLGKFHLVFPREKMFNHHFLDIIWRRFAKLLPFRRMLPFSYQPYWGYQWWCLTGECADYIVKFLDAKPRFENFFNRVWCPDEFFFQILLLNSPYKDQIINNCLTYVDFSQRKSHHPANLGVHDFPKFMASDKLFARKFDSSLDTEVLDMIDEYLDGLGKGLLPTVEKSEKVTA